MLEKKMLFPTSYEKYALNEGLSALHRWVSVLPAIAEALFENTVTAQTLLAKQQEKAIWAINSYAQTPHLLKAHAFLTVFQPGISLVM